MTGSLAYVLSKTFTTKSIEGISGTLAGKNATISDVQKVDGVTTVTFKWTADNGDTRTTQIQVADGETPEITITPITGGHRVTFTTDGTPQTVDIMDGVSVVSAEIKSNNHLELTLSDGTKIDCGEIISAKELDDLTDVNLGTLSDGDVLAYDEASGKWINREINYEIAVEDLTDVNINKATLVNGDIIKWDATAQKWVKGQIPTIDSLNDVGDVDLTSPTNGQILVYDDTDDKWKNVDNTIVADIDDLGDVDIDTTTLENGQILKYDSVSHKWVNGNASATSTKIEDLADVSVDSATLEDGMVLVWDATNQVWVNQQGGGVIDKLDDIGDVQFANLHDGDMIKYDAINHIWFNIGMDNAPTQNSDNLLDSNAVYQSEKLIKDKMGDLSQLDTTIKSDLVNAINEVKSDGGDLSTLTTDDKTSLVGAINEVDTHADENKTNIGTLANLTTTDKTNIVRAVNEIDANFKGLKYVEQVTTLGNPEDKANKVVQYVGASSGDLVRGYFYYSAPSIDQGVVIYTWEQLSIQPTNNDYDNLINKPEIAGVELSGDKSLDDLGINGKFQYDVLPTATSALTGKVVQYIGGTTADYKTNYFYQCVYDSDTSSYVWKNVDVSGNAELLNRIVTLETNQGDMTQLTIPNVTNLVGAINVLAIRGIKSITYSEPYLTITLMDNSTFQFDITVILNATEIGELGNVLDSTIQNGELLAYDTSILKYKPYNVVSALSATLQSSKDYTDQQIASAVQEDAYICDDGHKPTCTYDSSSGQYIVVYYQNNTLKTTTAISSRFYYKDNNGDPYCVSWFVTGDPNVDPVEFLYLVSAPDFDDFVNKNTDIVSTYSPDMVDKTKVPNIASLDALYALVATALSAKTNVADIVDNLLSDDATVPLSAKQGKVLKGLIDEKQDIIQMSVMPQCTQQMVTNNVVLQYIGTSSLAYEKGYWYEAKYNENDDVYYWSEIKYSPDMVEITSAEVDALWA